MRKAGKWLVVAAVFFAVGYGGIYRGIIPGAGIEGIETRLRADALSALQADGHGWARVTMSGQTARLSGMASDRDTAMSAAETVRGAAWSGGRIAGGITAVDITRVRYETMRNAPLPVAAPYSWSALLAEGGPLRLVGFVPDDRVRQGLLAEAASLFSVEIVDEMQLARGVPSGDWYRAAGLGLSALSQMDSGELRAMDRRFTLQGHVVNEEMANNARRRLAAFPAELSAVPMISVGEAPNSNPHSNNETE